MEVLPIFLGRRGEVLSYAVVRMQKMKSHDLKGIQFHNQRERESKTNPDIDKEKSKENYDLVHDDKINYNEYVKEIIASQKTGERKTRKDAVLVNELLVTSDREFFDKLNRDETRKFFRDSLHVVEERYGKENIAYATVHMDEKTPHMHVGVVPMREGRLQGKNIFNRQELLWLQDAFPQKMKQMGFKLERGQKGSDREHLSTADFKLKTEREKIENEIDQLEKKISGKKNELLVLSEETSDEVKIPAKREFKNIEVESKEKNLFGKPKKEMQKKPTGNVVMAEEDFKKIVIAARDNKRLKSGLETVLKTDLFKENEQLRGDLKKTKKDLEITKSDLQTREQENKRLKSQISDLRHEIQMIYTSAKEFLKERTDDLKTFKNVFKDLVDKIRGETTGSEFERLHKREKAREYDRDMER